MQHPQPHHRAPAHGIDAGPRPSVSPVHLGDQTDVVIRALEQTLDKNEQIRQAAERQLTEASALSGFLTLLLQIVAAPQTSSNVKQSASIALKNAIRRNWKNPDDDDLISPAGNVPGIVIPDLDREVIRNNILEAIRLSSQPRSLDDLRPLESSVVRVLAECVGLIAEVDFPQRWPSLVNELLRFLTAAQDRSTLGSILLSLRRVMKRYEYRRSSRKAANKPESENPRRPLNLLVDGLFPILVNFAQALVNDPVEDGSLLRLVGKIFHSAMRLEVPPLLRDRANLEQWMNVWKLALERTLPTSQGGSDEIDDLNLRPWWKVKKCALEITLRLFQEAANPLNDSELTVGAAVFIDGGIAGRFLVLAVQLLEAWTVHDAPLPKRVLQLCLAFCLTALEPAKTYKLLRPNLKFLVADVVLKVLAFSPEDAALWHDEPETFAAESTSPMDDPYDPRATACVFLVDACKLRSKDVLDGLVQHLLMVFNSNPSPPLLDAALYAVGALAEVLAPPVESSVMEEDYDAARKSTKKKKKKKGAAARAEKYASQLEQLMSAFVVPQLSSPHHHVRLRAVWVIGQYAHIQWINTGIIKQAFGGLLDRIADPELPVQAMACKSLKLVFSLDPMLHILPCAVLKEITTPRLVSIVQSYLQVMSRLGADEIVAGLESLIDAFQEEIAPMAADICLAITQAFTHYANQEEDDEGEYAMAAMQCLDAVTGLLESVVDTPELLRRMEPAALPLIASIFNPALDVSDFLEGALRLYSYFTYYSPLPISNDVWLFVGKMSELFHGYAFDYLEDMAIPLEHLALREPLRFASGSDSSTGGKKYVDVAYSMCVRILGDVNPEDCASEKDVRAAVGLLTAMLQSLPRPQTFAPVIPDIFRMIAHWLTGQNHTDLGPSTRTRCIECLEACIFHAPSRVVEVLPGPHIGELLNQIRPTLSSHRGEHRRKAAAFGLISLVAVPGVAARHKADALAMVAELLRSNDDDDDDDNDEEEDDEIVQDDNDQEDDEDDGEYDPDEDAANEDDLAYAEFLKTKGDLGGAYWDDEEGDYDDAEDPEDYPWPFSTLDVNASLRQAIDMAMKAPDGSELADHLSLLSPTERSVLTGGGGN